MRSGESNLFKDLHCTEMIYHMISVFRSHVLEMFETLLQEESIENRCHEEDLQVTLTFVRSEYVLGGFVPSLEHYNGEICFIMELDVWPQKVQRVFVTSEFSPSRNLGKRPVLRDAGRDENTNTKNKIVDKKVREFYRCFK